MAVRCRGALGYHAAMRRLPLLFAAVLPACGPEPAPIVAPPRPTAAATATGAPATEVAAAGDPAPTPPAAVSGGRLASRGRAGRAAMAVHLLTGASAIGVEVQSHLVRAARDLAERMNVSRVSWVHGDAELLTGSMTTGSVFFLYCPFSGDRLERVLDDLEPIARTRRIRVCAVDLPLPHRPWLTLVSPPSGDLAVYRSTLVNSPART